MTDHHPSNKLGAMLPFNAQGENPMLRSSKGRVWIRVVEARNMTVRDPTTVKPYCVVEFEKNEFVSKEPISIRLADSATTINTIWRHEALFDIARPDGEFIITVWNRMATSEGEAFLGMIRVSPSQIHGKMHDHWYQLMPRYPQESITGELRIQFVHQLIMGKPLTANDFDLLKVLGKGSFGKVLQVRKKDTGRIYAMKILNKKNIVERKEVQHTLSERNVLIQATSPFLVGLKFSFQTPDKLYLVLDYMNGGEVFYHLQKEQVFSEFRAKFYAAELVLALEHLHLHGIVYRDLKPENVLLDSSGHVSLTDFGLCKENLYDATTNTFCGTAEYLAPEVLVGNGYGRSVDWWSLGILLFEMSAGIPPFFSENTNTMYNKIIKDPLIFPPNIFSVEAQDLISRLLDRNPTTRFGSGPMDAEEVKRHAFFNDIDWEKLVRKQIAPPFKPVVESETDTSNFDATFTESLPEDSLPNSAPLSETLQDHFKGFTYTGESHLPFGSLSSTTGTGMVSFGALAEE